MIHVYVRVCVCVCLGTHECVEQFRVFFIYIYIILCKYSMSSICHPASDGTWICSKHLTVKAVQCMLLLFLADCLNRWRLWALAEHKPNLSESPTGKSQEWSDQEVLEFRKWTCLTEPFVRQLPIQECCHIIVGVWWHYVTLQNNIWFIWK
jgi:hypothetical protein